MSSSPVLYGSRITLYWQALNGYVVSTSSAESPVGLMEHDPVNGKRLPFEQALFVVKSGDPAGSSSANRNTGDVVKYGQTVCLEHHARQQPLCCHREQHAIGLKGNLRVLLERKSGSTLKVDRWRVMPRYRLRVEGEPVMDGDPVILQSVGVDQFLNSADNLDDDMGAGNHFVEVSCGSDMQGFQMRVYDGDVGPKFADATLRCGDCITLFHTEERKFVNAELTSKRCLLKAPEATESVTAEDSGMDPTARADGPGGVTGSGRGGPLSGHAGPSTELGGDGLHVSSGGGGGASAPLPSRRLANSEDISYLTLFILENADPSRGGAVQARGRTLYRLKSMSTGLYLRTGVETVPDALEPGHAGTPFSAVAGPGSPSSPLKDFAPFPSASAPASPTLPGTTAGVAAAADVLGEAKHDGFPLAGDGLGADNADGDAGDAAARTETAAAQRKKSAAVKHGLRNTAYQLSLTNNAAASGTLFRLQSASASSSEFLLSGSHIFIEAPNTDSGRLFLVAGGPVSTVEGSTDMTVASLSQRSVFTGDVTLYGRPIRSMRDGLEVRRLRPKLLRELSVIRSYIPPLERYAFNMLRGVGDPYRLREVKENLQHLMRLCELHADTSATGDGASEEASSPCDPLASRRNVAGNIVDVVWQGKLFHQGVPALVLQVVYATLKCPYVNPHMLYTSEMVTAPASSSASLPASRAKDGVSDSRPAFTPVRYTELAELVDSCFTFLAMLVSGRPRFAQTLLPYSDLIMNCSTFIPAALQCLAIFYTNNAVFVELPAARPRLEQFLRALAERPRDPALIEMVRLFAQCGEESMVEAQTVILSFFADSAVAEKVFTPIALRPPQEVLDMQLLELGTTEYSAAAASSTSAGSPVVSKPTDSAALLPRAAAFASLSGATNATDSVSATSAAAAGRHTTAQQADARRWAERLHAGEPMLLVGLPNAIFAQASGSEAMSITVSTQFRGRPNVLGRLLQSAADLESPDGVTWFPLEGLASVADDWPEIADVFLPYFVEQTRLLAALASGRNASATQEFIPAWVSPEALAATLQSTSLPPALHAALTDLFTNTQVNVSGAMQVRENIRNVRRVVTGTPADASADSTMGTFVCRSPPSCFAVAKAYIFAFLAQTTMSSDDDVVVVFAAALRLTEGLLCGGAFPFNDYEQLAMLLTRALDPNTDDVRYYIHTKAVHDCKVHALRLLNVIMDILAARHATQLVDYFRSDRPAPYVSQLYQLTPTPPPYAAERQRLASGKSHATCCTCLIEPCRECEACCHATSNCIRRLLGRPLKDWPSGDDDDGDDETTFELSAQMLRTLMQLANTTKSTRLRSLAIYLFFRLTSGPQELLRVASRVQLLTSMASEGFFSTVNWFSAQLSSLLKRPFRRTNTIASANRLLAALCAFLSEAADQGDEDGADTGVDPSAALSEKLTMARRVGLHMGLLQMLQQMPLPLTDATRQTIDSVFAVMARMRVDPMIASDLQRHMDVVTPLVWAQTALLPLLRTLFLCPITSAATLARESAVVPRRILCDIVHCLGTPYALMDGAAFLTDYLATRHPHNQQMVWRELVSDPEAARVVQFRHHWCGPQGQRLRETALTSPDAYKPNGRLARHEAVCRLLCAITEENDLVKPEEVRHEVFGLNSVDALMEVASDALLPTFFRRLYLPLIKSLVLVDKTAMPILMAHRNFPLFLRTCVFDLARYLQLTGGSCYSPDLEEELARHEELALVAPPSNAVESDMDRKRFGVEMYEEVVTGPLCDCLQLICLSFSASVERLNSRLRSQLVMAVNEVVDALCDVVVWVLGEVPTATTAGVTTWAADEAKIDLGETMSPDSGGAKATAQPARKRQWDVLALSRLNACLTSARAENFKGSARWRGGGFHMACDLVNSAFLVAGGDKAADEARTQLAYRHQHPSETASTQRTEADRALAPFTTTAANSSMSHGSDRVASSRGGRASSATSHRSEDDMLSTRWSRFLHDSLSNIPACDPEKVYVSAAGAILRTGDYGALFLQTLLCALPTLPADHVTHVLQLLRQIVLLTPGDPLDDSVCLPFQQRTYELRRIQVSTPLALRQAYLARWPGDATLEFPLPVIGLVTEYVGSGYWSVRHAALRAAVTLLKGGQRHMQESYLAHCLRTSDEQLFFVLRNHMASFTEELRAYSFAVRRGTSPAEAAHFLQSHADIILELRLLQLFCAGQFAPLQTYLASQPDNTISVNLIESLVELLSMAPKTADEVTFPFYHQLLATITETLQGPCRINQDTFVSYRAADFLTQLFSEPVEPPHPKAVLTAYESRPPRHKRDARRRRRDAERQAEKAARQRRTNEKRRAKQQQVSSRHHHNERGLTNKEPTSAAVAIVVPAEGDTGKTALLLTTTSSRPLAAVRRDCASHLQGSALACLLALLEGRQDPAVARKVLSTVDLTVLADSMDASATEYELLHGSVDRAQSKGFASGDLTNSLRVLKRYFRDFFHNDFPEGHDELEDELALAISIYTFFRACFDMQHLALTSAARRGDQTGAATSGAASTGLTSVADDFVDKRGRSIRDVLRRTKHYLALHSKVAKVEIVRGGSLERAYFRVLSSSVDNLGAERRDEVIRNAVRTSDNERIQNYFYRSSEVIVEMNVYSRVRRHIVLYFLNYFSRELILLVLCVVVALNLMMIIGLRQPTSPYTKEYGDDNTITSINALGIALIAVQGVLVAQALFGPATITVTTRWQNWRSRREEKIVARARRDIAGDTAEYLAADKKLRSRPWYEFIARSFVYMITDVTLLQQLFFLAVAILGFVHNRIWYSIQLLQISLWAPSLNNLFRALGANFSSLLLTFVLLLIVIFIFAIISFFKFSQLFDPLDARGNGFNCYTLSQCWLVHIDTLRNSGGVGDVAEWPVYYSKDGFGYWFTFFRLAYYVVAVLVVTNLFLGVIVDSLARFRMEQEFVHVDQTKKCFICGQERNMFDVVQPGAYDTHITEEHNMWQYIYFLHYLSKKDPSTFTGQEAYVHTLVQLRDVTFFPIGKSLMLSALTNSADENGEADAAEAARHAAEEERQATIDALDSGIRKAVDPVNKKLDETQDTLARMMSTLLQLQQMQNHLADQTPSFSTSSSGASGFLGGDMLLDDDGTAISDAPAAGNRPPPTARSANSSVPYGGLRRDENDDD